MMNEMNRDGHARADGGVHESHAADATLFGAWRRIQEIAAQAVSQRLSTEMSDLAMQIRKYHDGRHIDR